MFIIFNGSQTSTSTILTKDVVGWTVRWCGDDELCVSVETARGVTTICTLYVTKNVASLLKGNIDLGRLRHKYTEVLLNTILIEVYYEEKAKRFTIGSEMVERIMKGSEEVFVDWVNKK